MSRQRGFSLVELLVVLAIAGLMTGLAVAGLGSGQARVDQALQRLASETRAQAALARHAGQLRGLRWNGQRPEFVRRERDGWVVEPVSLGEWPKGLQPDWPASGWQALHRLALQVCALCGGQAHPASAGGLRR